jgi:hypothetical protein
MVFPLALPACHGAAIARRRIDPMLARLWGGFKQGQGRALALLEPALPPR